MAIGHWRNGIFVSIILSVAFLPLREAGRGCVFPSGMIGVSAVLLVTSWDRQVRPLVWGKMGRRLGPDAPHC